MQQQSLGICSNCSVLSSTVPKHEAAAASSSGGLGGMIFILVFLLLAGTGLTLYCFYKRRHDRQMFTTGFDNAIYRGDIGTHESNCLVTNIEENEQATI